MSKVANGPAFQPIGKIEEPENKIYWKDASNGQEYIIPESFWIKLQDNPVFHKMNIQKTNQECQPLIRAVKVEDLNPPAAPEQHAPKISPQKHMVKSQLTPCFSRNNILESR